ncbi:MAG: hypothetical protein E7774_03235 [Bradyrhizobium sp.]|nr:MAG: hypothetical protein E7774_03235 [Bradyrhizobium sp.]
MRVWGVAVAVAFAAAQIACAQAASSLAPSGPPRPPDARLRLAQVIPDTSPAEANIGNPSLAPLKWVGLLAIPDPTDKNPLSIVECTGEFIKPNVVLTAAHCLRDLPENQTGPWPDVTKGTFWLQYQNQQGTPFKVLCGAVNPLWTLPSNFASLSDDDKDDAKLVAYQHDFAMLLIDGQSPTGVMPYMLDWKGKYGYATRVGYSSDILNGQVVEKAGGAVFFADAIPMLAKSFPAIVVQWAPTTELTSGSSGGAWIANFNTTEGANQNLLIAVTSFSFDDYPGGEGAAYLTAKEFNPLLDFVSKGCQSAPPAPSSPPAPWFNFGKQSNPAGGGSN